MENLSQLFDMMTSNDTDTNKTGYRMFSEIYANKTHQIAMLCEQLFSKPTPEQLSSLNPEQRTKLIVHRHLAGVLLRKSLREARAWEELSVVQKQYVKQQLVVMLLAEEEKQIRKAIIYVIAMIMQHEPDDNWFGGIIEEIFKLCIDVDLDTSKRGGHMTAILCESSSGSFKPHMDKVCNMFYDALSSCKRCNNFTMPIMLNLFEGMSHLVPNIKGNKMAEEMVVQIAPTLMQALHALINGSGDFESALSMFEMLTDYCSDLLCGNCLQSFIEFCLHTLTAVELDLDLRVRMLNCINNFMYNQSTEMMEQNLFEPIVNALFFLISNDTELEAEEDEEINYYLEDDAGSMLPSAMRSIELVAWKMPADKLMTQLFSLFDRALDNPEEVGGKRAIYLVIGSIAESIQSRYVQPILNLTAMGMQGHERCVRNAAYFAFRECSSNLPTELSACAPKMLLILLNEMHSICIKQLRHDDRLPQYGSMFFVSLDFILMNMDLQPYLHKIMDHLFEILNPLLPERLLCWGLNALGTLIFLVKRQMLPYRNKIVQVVKQNLLNPTEFNSENKVHDMRLSLGKNAVETLASLIKHSGMEKADPLIPEAMDYALLLLNTKNSEYIRSSAINLIAALSKVAKEDMHCVFPKFMERVFTALETGFEDDDDETTTTTDAGGNNNETDDDDSETAFYYETHMDAINAVTEFSIHTGTAFLPYLERVTELIFNLIYTDYEEIVDSAINAVPQFLRAMRTHKQDRLLVKTLHKLVPKLIVIIEKQRSAINVSSALNELTSLMSTYKANALPTVAVRNELGKVLLMLLNEKTLCQDNQSHNWECDFYMSTQNIVRTILLGSLTVVPVFGKALTTDDFTQFFAVYCPQLLRKLEETKGKKDYEEFRAMGFYCVGQCLPLLQRDLRSLFDVLVPKLIDACNDSSCQIQQNALCLFGELVYYAKDYSYGAFPIIIAILQQSVEKMTEHSLISDKSEYSLVSDKLCGCIARLMIVNINLIPLPRFVPLLMQNTPLQQHFADNFYIVKCFDVLRQQAADIFNVYFQHIMAVCIQIMQKKEYIGNATYAAAFELLRDMQRHNATTFNSFIAGNQSAYNYLSSLKTQQ